LGILQLAATFKSVASTGEYTASSNANYRFGKRVKPPCGNTETNLVGAPVFSSMTRWFSNMKLKTACIIYLL
jgi:hypothetical protein